VERFGVPRRPWRSRMASIAWRCSSVIGLNGTAGRPLPIPMAAQAVLRASHGWAVAAPSEVGGNWLNWQRPPSGGRGHEPGRYAHDESWHSNPRSATANLGPGHCHAAHRSQKFPCQRIRLHGHLVLCANCQDLKSRIK